MKSSRTDRRAVALRSRVYSVAVFSFFSVFPRCRAPFSFPSPYPEAFTADPVFCGKNTYTPPPPPPPPLPPFVIVVVVVGDFRNGSHPTGPEQFGRRSVRRRLNILSDNRRVETIRFYGDVCICFVSERLFAVFHALTPFAPASFAGRYVSQRHR